MEDKEEEVISFNPIDDRLIGASNGYVYFKSEYKDYIVVVTEEQHLKLTKKYVKSKRAYCESTGYFCGVFGDFYAEKYKRGKDIILNEYINVEDDEIEVKKVPYPTYFVREFDKHCDMEHG